MIRLAVQGASGRLGRTIASLAEGHGNFLVRPIGRDDLNAASLEEGDVLLDVSTPTASLALAELAAGAGKPLVIGTTGHDVSQLAALSSFSRTTPIVLAPNFSVGVNLLFWLSAEAARTLGPEFQTEIVELHHRFKKDAPSGTALRVAETIARMRGLDQDDLRHGRAGQVGERSDKEIGIHALRGGDVVGEHTVYFLGQSERLELTHRATDRTVFARGALRAAEWIVGKPPALYDMQDVLGLKR
jgi:4-hydroxy-tetrahydrodipicolinate reductase